MTNFRRGKTNPETLYIAGNQVVYRSTDGGESWGDFSNDLTNIVGFNNIVERLAIDSSGTALHAGTDGFGVFDYQISDTVCDYSIRNIPDTFSNTGGDGILEIISKNGCGWVATTNVPWVNFTTQIRWTGTGSVSYEVQRNPGLPRAGTIHINGQTFVVTQDSGCTYSIAPDSQNFAAAGGTSATNVTADAGCTWTATSNASFITITGGNSGSANGTVNFSVGANTGAGRTGTMTIADKTFTVTQQQGSPTIAGFSPMNGCAGGTIIISGSAFTAATNVKFNGVDADFTVSSDSQISATVPQGAATGPISVTTPQGTTTSSSSFTVNIVATITGFTPTAAKAGAKVTVSGANLSGATSVTFGGVETASIKKNTSTSLKATVPAGAVTGRIVVTTPTGCPAISGTDFFAVPSITSVTPASGSPGTTVTITGLNFHGATTVLFKKTPAQFTVVNNTTITATVPAGSTSGPIKVTTPAGTAKSASAFTVTP